MQSKLVHVQKRTDELEALANEIAALAARLKDDEKVQPDLSVKGQRWYRGAREILVQAKSSALEEFEGQSIAGHLLITDPETLSVLAQAGALQLDEIYALPESSS